MEAVGTSETCLLNENTLRCIPEKYHLRKQTKYTTFYFLTLFPANVPGQK
jgi:hypothetical protein